MSRFPVSKVWAIASTGVPLLFFVVFVLVTPPPLFMQLLFSAFVSACLFGFIRYVFASTIWRAFNEEPTQPEFRMRGVYSDYRKAVSYELEKLSYVSFRESGTFLPRFGWEPTYSGVSNWQLSDICGFKEDTTFDDYTQAMEFFQRFSDGYILKTKKDQEAKDAVFDRTGEVASFNTETGEIFIK